MVDLREEVARVITDAIAETGAAICRDRGRAAADALLAAGLIQPLPAPPLCPSDDFTEATRRIREWVNGGAVSTQHLAVELRYWAWWAGQSDEAFRAFPPAVRVPVEPKERE